MKFFESMAKKDIATGMVHKVPTDLRKTLTSDPKALTAWKDITPLARNEWICWIESAKKPETKNRRPRKSAQGAYRRKAPALLLAQCPHR